MLLLSMACAFYNPELYDLSLMKKRLLVSLQEMQEAGYDVTGGTAGAASSSSPGGKPVTA